MSTFLGGHFLDFQDQNICKCHLRSNKHQLFQNVTYISVKRVFSTDHILLRDLDVYDSFSRVMEFGIKIMTFKVTCFTSSERSGYFFIKRLNFSVCHSCSWIKEWKVMTLWSMVGQNKDSELHISSTILVIHNFRICFDFHFVMDCKNDYNFNYLWITLSFARFFSHSFDSFIYYKQKNQAN